MKVKKIELSNGGAALVDEEDYEMLSRWKWYKHHGYAYRTTLKEGKHRILAMHRAIAKTPDNLETDHINGNILDNRKINLRICNKNQNQWNAKLRKDNQAGYKGVSFNKITKKWYARIRTNNKVKCLGYFFTPQEAAMAYDKAALKYHGEYTKGNFFILE